MRAVLFHRHLFPNAPAPAAGALNDKHIILISAGRRRLPGTEKEIVRSSVSVRPADHERCIAPGRFTAIRLAARTSQGQSACQA